MLVLFDTRIPLTARVVRKRRTRFVNVRQDTTVLLVHHQQSKPSARLVTTAQWARQHSKSVLRIVRSASASTVSLDKQSPQIFLTVTVVLVGPLLARLSPELRSSVTRDSTVTRLRLRHRTLQRECHKTISVPRDALAGQWAISTTRVMLSVQRVTFVILVLICAGLRIPTL
jgi:hypothetical protein